MQRASHIKKGSRLNFNKKVMEVRRQIHDIQNYLGAAQGYAELLKMYAEQDREKFLQFLDSLEQVVKKAMGEMGEVQDFCRHCSENFDALEEDFSLEKMENVGEEVFVEESAENEVDLTGCESFLCVEDDAAFAEMLKLYFETLGYEVSLAADGKEALQLVEDQEFDLVICDYRLPDMKGLDLLEKIREKFPKLRLVLISGDAFSQKDLKARDLKLSAFFHKPFILQEMAVQVRKILDGQPLAQFF